MHFFTEMSDNEAVESESANGDLVPEGSFESNSSVYSSDADGSVSTKKASNATSVTFASGVKRSREPTNKYKKTSALSHLSVKEIQKLYEDTEVNAKKVSDLIDEIEKLRFDLADIKNDRTADKLVRRKKEKNLVKLAKQMTSLNSELKAKEDDILKLKVKIDDQETVIEGLENQISSLAQQAETTATEHHKEIIMQQDILRKTRRDSSQQIDEINSRHAEVLKELRAQLLSTTLRADELSVKLARDEMLWSPESARDIARNTFQTNIQSTSLDLLSPKNMTNSLSHHRKESSTSKSRRIILTFFRVLSLFLVSFFAVFFTFCSIFKHHLPPAFMSTVCSPSPPGTILTSSSNQPALVQLDAPWWAPPFMKERAFELLCNFTRRTSPANKKSSPRTQIQWIKENHHDRKLFIISSIEQEPIISKNSKNKDVSQRPLKKSTILKKHAKTVVIRSETIEIFERNNKRSTSIEAPWKIA